jgi:hypothetical protein
MVTGALRMLIAAFVLALLPIVHAERDEPKLVRQEMRLSLTLKEYGLAIFDTVME